MIDGTDELLVQLATGRPDLDVETVALSTRVIRLARQLEIGRREALARRGLEVWEYDVLLALRGAGGRQQLSPSALMAATQVASGTMTNRIDRLAARALVTRAVDPADGRGVLVRLTPAGRRRVDHAMHDVATAESSVWAVLSHRRREQLAALLRVLQA